MKIKPQIPKIQVKTLGAAIRNSKWYWYLPLFWFIYLHKMTKWTIEGKDHIECSYRVILLQLLMFPQIFYVFYILFHFHVLSTK